MYTQEKMANAYFGFFSAIIQAKTAGNSIMKTKFLISTMNAKNIKIIEIFFKRIPFVFKHKKQMIDCHGKR